MVKREKIMIYVIIALFAALVTKSLLLDEVKVTGDELKFKQFVEKSVHEEKKYNGFLAKHGITTYRVVSIEKIHEEGTSCILAYDEEHKEYKEIKIKGDYLSKVRGYLFYVIPYKEFKVKSNWSGK